MLTSASILLVTTPLLTYYYTVHDFIYYICVGLIALFIIVNVYFCYYFERMQKL